MRQPRSFNISKAAWGPDTSVSGPLHLFATFSHPLSHSSNGCNGQVSAVGKPGARSPWTTLHCLHRPLAGSRIGSSWALNMCPEGCHSAGGTSTGCAPVRPQAYCFTRRYTGCLLLPAVTVGHHVGGPRPVSPPVDTPESVDSQRKSDI